MKSKQSNMDKMDLEGLLDRLAKDGLRTSKNSEAIIETIELDDTENIACPFCNKILMDVEELEPFKTCEHTIFVLTDESFEYVRPDYRDIIKRPNSGSRDEYTANLEMPEAIRIARYAPSPSCFGEYFGFVKETNNEYPK